MKALFNIIEGNTQTELVLKASCCGRDTVLSYVAGVHFTVEDLITFGVNKKVKGRQLWAMGLLVMRSIKKALSIVTKLSLSICIIDVNCAVISYASGKNKSTLMQYVDNGMYALTLSEGDSIPVDEVCSDDDDDVLGAFFADGMPLTRDAALIERVRVQTAEVLPLREGSPWQGEVVLARETNDGKVVDDKFNRDDDDEGLVEESDPLSDPFGGVIAPQGYVYMGKLAFICFSPTLKYFAGTLVMGRQSNQTVQEKKDGSRKAQRKVNTERADRDRVVGTDRGLSLQSKMQCTMMAQKEDDAEQRNCDMRLVMLTKQIESTEQLVELKLKTSERMSLGGSEAQVFLSINMLMEKLEKLNETLDNMMNETRKMNPIVGNVLAVDVKAMGLAKREEDYNMGFAKQGEDYDNNE